MANQSFIFNSSNSAGPVMNNPFNVDKSALIRAAGLAVDLPIYFSAGVCHNCGPNDQVWQPLVICGNQITIGPDNVMLVLEIPGKYSLGDPTVPLVLAGDVNITKEEGVHQFQVPKACPSVEVEVCDPLVRGINASW
jgi:hypothetical protein